MSKAQKSVMMAAETELKVAGLYAKLHWTEDLLVAVVSGGLQDRVDAMNIMQAVEDQYGWECCAVEDVNNPAYC